MAYKKHDKGDKKMFVKEKEKQNLNVIVGLAEIVFGIHHRYEIIALLELVLGTDLKDGISAIQRKRLKKKLEGYYVERLMVVERNIYDLKVKMKKALCAVLDGDNENALEIIKWCFTHYGECFKGSDLNALAMILPPYMLKEFLFYFITTPGTFFKLVADRLIEEYGEESFREMLIKNSPKCESLYTYRGIINCKGYLSDEIIAKRIDDHKQELIIDLAPLIMFGYVKGGKIAEDSDLTYVLPAPCLYPKGDPDREILEGRGYEEALKVVKESIGKGDLDCGQYDNILAKILPPSDLRDLLYDFFTCEGVDFDLVANKLIEEYGEESFRETLLENLPKWDPLHVFIHIEKYEKYLSEEEIATLTIDRYPTFNELEKNRLRDCLRPYYKTKIEQIAENTGREFHF